MTLFELLVVVAIAVILIFLAVLSTRSLITRTKVSRVKEEHRVLVRALQNYSMDYSEFPSSKQGLESLLKPTAYMGELPKDPFQKRDHSYLYLFPNTVSMGCVLISPGPDGDFDLPFELWDFVSMRNVDEQLMPVRISSMRHSSRSANNESGGQRFGVMQMNEAQLAILSTYIKLGQYDQDKGGDGDIITVLR